MNRSRAWIAGGCALALIGLSGCSDDDDDGAALDADQATVVVEAAVTRVILPLYTAIVVIEQVSSAALAGAATPRGGTCDPVGICTGGGTYQVCDTGATFTTCEEEGGIIDGTVTVTDPLTLAVAFDLDVSGTSIVGPARLRELVSCGPGITFNNLVGSADDVTASVDGTVELCPTVEGTLESIVLASGDSAEVVWTFDGSDEVLAVVSDPSNGDIVATCTVSLPSGDTQCEPY